MPMISIGQSLHGTRVTGGCPNKRGIVPVMMYKKTFLDACIVRSGPER